MTPEQRQNLIGIINAVHSAIVVLSNYAQTTSDPQQLDICQQTIASLNTIGSTALQALQAADDQIFQQETATLKASTTQLRAEEARINALLQTGGIALQVVSASAQIAALIAAL